MVVAVIDDHRLLTLLAGPRLPSGRYATTCSWWWRLTSAFAGDQRGALTRRLERLDPPSTASIRRTLATLPAHFEVVDLRLLVPAMAVLVQTHPVDQLGAEAVAAAAYLRTEIQVEIDAPQTRAAAIAEDVRYSVA